jgi:hypothetical protein
MMAADGQGQISRKERTARDTVAMPAGHPELVTRKPGRTEWRLFTAWLTELWPHDEYRAIAAEKWQQDRPPGNAGWR